MTKLKWLGATALVISSAIAAPAAMAQQAVTNPGQCAQYYPDANCKTRGPGAYNSPSNGSYQRNRDLGWNNNGWNNGYNNTAYNNGWDRRDNGFWPANAAADVVGGAVYTADAAVNTAGAIATAPFRSDAYASYNPGYDNTGRTFNDNDRNRGWYEGKPTANTGYNNGYNNVGYNNGWNNNGGWYQQSYAERNGFVCQPGSWFRGQDGRRHICQ